jgi:ferric-dicitrate binding protein FerR (iron transport regulator)
LTLVDGTKMHVNSRSKIIYPNVFDTNKREVYVEGEAYFEVAHNANIPFVVKTAGFEVKVHGTMFDVLSYKELDKAIVTLVEGSVSVTNSRKESIQLKPSECVQITSGTIGIPEYTNTSTHTSWVQGYYSFDSTPLKDVVDIISFYFDKNIILDEKIQELSISGNLDVNLSLEKILQNVSSTLELRFYEKEGNIYLSKAI